MGSVTNSGQRAGHYLTHPVVWLSIAILVINDHYLKDHVGGWIPGKLSDFAGLVFFPLVLAGVLDLVSVRMGSPLSESGRRRVVRWTCACTGIVFAAIQLSETAATAYRYAVAALQWPYHALVALVSNRPSPALAPVDHTADPSDLVALIILIVPLWLSTRPRPPRRPDEPPRRFRDGGSHGDPQRSE